MQPMCPWYQGFTGSITLAADKESYDVTGVIEVRGPTTLEISELPLRKWTQDYKEFLQDMLPNSERPSLIEDFKEYHTEKRVHFVITVTEEQMAKLQAGGLEKMFKLRTSLSISNMFFFDQGGKIRRYSNVLEIMQEFAELRLAYYHRRKAHLVEGLRRQHEVISEKVRFIRLVIAEELVVKNRPRAALVANLRALGFRTLREITGLDVREETAAAEAAPPSGFDYLLGMPVWSLSAERIEEMERQLREKAAELDRLRHTAAEEIWEADLDALSIELRRRQMEAVALQREERATQAAGRKRAAATQTSGRGKRRRPDAAGAPTLPPPPPLTRRPSDDVFKVLRELQERHLTRTRAELPGLFGEDLAPRAPLPSGAAARLRTADGSGEMTATASGDEAEAEGSVALVSSMKRAPVAM